MMGDWGAVVGTPMQSVCDSELQVSDYSEALFSLFSHIDLFSFDVSESPFMSTSNE